MPDYVTIPKSEYVSLIMEVQRGVKICGKMTAPRLALQAIEENLAILSASKETLREIRRAIECCEDVARLYIELSALERRLREFDQSLTPLRPPSRTDIQAAFTNSVEFAQGKKKV